MKNSVFSKPLVSFLFFFLFFIVPESTLYADAPMGPLGGRNVYAPYQPWFSFPAMSAAPLPKDAIRGRTGIYILNEFNTYPFNPDDYILDAEGRLSPAVQDTLTTMDFESTIIELGVDWQALPKWRFSADWRLYFRYGGFMDSTIEWWHSLFGFPNGGREYFSHNRSYWNITNSSNITMRGEGSVVTPGDLDLSALWTFLNNPKLNLAAAAAFKIPITSGYPDIAAEFLLDWQPWKRWIFYLNTGVIFPMGSGAFIMGQIIPAVEFRAARGLSILLQMNIQSSPVIGDIDYIHPLFGQVTMFALPQTDLKIGLKGRAGRFGWQFYMEEDPLTWEGPDILLYFGADWTF